MTLMISDMAALLAVAVIFTLQMLEWRSMYVSKKLEEMEKCDD